jgi:hypothetical protein
MADTLNFDSRAYGDGGYDGRRVGRELFRDALANVRARARRPVRKLRLLVDSYYQGDYLEGWKT